MKRRDFLKNATSIGLASLFSESIIDLINLLANNQLNCQASEILSSKNYIQFNLFGAPSRWAFDHILRPTSDDKFIPTHGIYNKFIKPRGAELLAGEYSTFSYNQLNIPQIWNTKLLTASSERRSLSSLLENTIFLRGCNIGTNGHIRANTQLIKASENQKSYPEILNALQNKSLGPINIGSSPASSIFLKSCEESVDIPSNEENYLEYLLSSFKKGGSFNKWIAENKSSIESIRSNLNVTEKSKAFRASLSKVDTFILDQTVTFYNEFPKLLLKYQNIFEANLLYTKILEVNDFEIPGAKFIHSIDKNLDETEFKKKFAGYHLNGLFMAGENILNTFKGAESLYLAKQFAFAEYILTNNLSNCILLSPPNPLETDTYSLENLNEFKFTSFNKLKNSQSLNLQKMNPGYKIAHDSHGVGWILNVITTNLFFLQFGSGLLELTNSLKNAQRNGKSIFDQTLIHITSEFDRLPNSFASDTSHLPTAHINTFISGSIKECEVMGNIYVGNNPPPTFPKGTIGRSAPIKELNRGVSIEDISSSVLSMLDVPKHLIPTDPLLSGGNKIKPLLPRGVNIEE